VAVLFSGGGDTLEYSKAFWGCIYVTNKFYRKLTLTALSVFVMCFVMPQQKTSAQEQARDTVVLVHGFLRSGSNMRYLALKLEQHGYRVLVPTLPTTFRSIRECSEYLARVLEGHIHGGGVTHFVGHSMGGLVIRDYLSRHEIEGLGRVVLIATPSGGSPYANLMLGVPFSQQIFESLLDLANPGPDIGLPRNVPAPDVGIIIGTQPDVVRRFLLPGEHDGVVTAESVRSIAASGEMLIPASHRQIHWRADTAGAIVSFLETGEFPALANELTIHELSSILNMHGLPNIVVPTTGGAFLWTDIAGFRGWRIQQNLITQHARILAPDNARVAWGSLEAMNKVFQMITQIP